MTAYLHSSHITDAVRRLDKGETMKAIKARLAAYDLPPTEDITEAFCLSHEETRKAGYRDQLQVLLLCLVDFESNPEPVPDVTPEKRAEHLEHAEHLRGIFRSHGIDPRDFDACMDYIIGNGNIVPRYWAKIYVDYIHGEDLDATRYTASLPPLGRAIRAFDLAKPGSERTAIAVSTPFVVGTEIHQRIERLIVTGQQASLLRADGYTGELEIVDIMPGVTADMADALHYAMTTPPEGIMGGHTHSTPTDWAQGYGRGMRAGFRKFTDQEARAAFNYQDKCKFNKFPRGKCARRMLTLGWHFNED